MAAKLQRRRAIIALVTVLIAIIALVVPLVGQAVAQNEPNITIINPSEGLDDGSEETPLMVSDAETGDDEEEDDHELTYRVNAWTSNTPDEALVEFELIAGLDTQTLGTAERVADDTFQFDWDVNVNDGRYTLRAILYEGSDIFAEEVDRHERSVVVLSGRPRPETTVPTVDIEYPVNGSTGGFYTNPISGLTNILVDFEFSDDTDGVFIFYTLSDPGDEPVWKECASDTFAGERGESRLRCDLESQDQGGLSVTAIAAVANDDDSGENDPARNTASDAVRLFPYDQDATEIEVNLETTRVDANAQGVFACSSTQSVEVLDQSDRPIGNINVDAHAQGPSDQTKFYTGTLFLPGFVSPSMNVVPDKAHGTELSYYCRLPERTNEVARNQGDHNRVGVPDVKHIENSGTGSTGTAGLAVHGDRRGGTFITFWVDEDNDDKYCSQELAVPASIGWDENAPVPVLEPAEVSICPVPTPPPPGTSPSPSGTTSPTPTQSPSEDPRGCTVRGTEGDDELRGTADDDVICGLGGDDDIRALDGDDVIHGDEGDDVIRAGGGNDTVDGGGGVDVVEGGGGDDIADGGDDRDILLGSRGDDTIRGNKSADDLEGGGGRDIVVGGSGNDRGNGGKGDDIMKGGTGNDVFSGSASPDTIRGGPQNDQLVGGGGPDTIRGGPGRDRCRGGGGRDRVSSCERSRERSR